MTLMPTRGAPRCRACGLYRETRIVNRFGNATATRRGRWQPSSICLECARGLVTFAPERQTWSVRGLRKAWGLR